MISKNLIFFKNFKFKSMHYLIECTSKSHLKMSQLFLHCQRLMSFEQNGDSAEQTVTQRDSKAGKLIFLLAFR